MKKSLVALAALSAISAFADVDVSGGIKLYGVLDQAVVRQNTNTSNTTIGVNASATGFFAAGATSRFGVKGERNLNENLKGFVQAEMELVPDESTLVASKNRGTFVGLEFKDVGTIKLGTQETMAYETFGNDVNGRVEYKPQVWRFTAGDSMQDRSNNSVRLTSTRIQGFQVSYLRGFGEKTDTGGVIQDKDYKSFAINYNNHGALTGALVTDSITNIDGKYCMPGSLNAGVMTVPAAGVSSAGAATAAGTCSPTASGDLSTKWGTKGNDTPLTRTIASISYDLGVAKLNYLMANAAIDGANGGTFNTNTFGVRIPMDQFTLAMSFGSGSYTAKNAANKTGSVSDTTLGGYYNFDKSTSVYLLTSLGKNTISSPVAAVGSATTTTTAMGVQYKY